MNLYMHFKGGLYIVEGPFLYSADGEDGTFITYTMLKNGTRWIRKSTGFSEDVEWPDGVMRPRFVRVSSWEYIVELALSAFPERTIEHLKVNPINDFLRLDVQIYVMPARDLPGIWIGHELDFDVVSQGENPEHAVDMCCDALIIAIQDDLQNDRDIYDRKRVPLRERQVYGASYRANLLFDRRAGWKGVRLT